jgi:acetyltransferase-like isoleucine patch superfamily enzyme
MLNRIIRAVWRRFWSAVARHLQYYLIRTSTVWGEPSRVTLGNNVWVGNAILNTRSGNIVIEDDVFFGLNVSVLTGTHDYRLTGDARLAAVPDSGRDITIRRGVWIASNVTILGPCVIGEDSVVMAGSVVCKDLPPKMLCGGIPARPIRAISFAS